MTPSELTKRLPALREFFPKEIQMSWSLPEYLVGMKETEEHLLAVLDKWKAENENPV